LIDSLKRTGSYELFLVTLYFNSSLDILLLTTSNFATLQQHPYCVNPNA